MKKLLSLILSLAMVMSLSATVLAATGIENNGSDSSVVKGTYVGNESSIVYSVDISWSDLEFTYTPDFKGEWNADTHEYENSAPATWNEGKGTITVTNHSNIDITATPAYSPQSGFESADMNFNVDVLQVATADNGVDGAAGTPVTATITVTPMGSLPEGTDGVTIGTITISIN